MKVCAVSETLRLPETLSLTIIPVAYAISLAEVCVSYYFNKLFWLG